MRVLLADKLAARTVTDLEAAGTKVTVDASLSGDSLEAQLERADPHVLVVRSTRVEARHLKAAPSLSVVIRAGAGVNTIDLPEAARRGIYVANCPGKNAIAVAELTMAHLLNCDRRLADNVAAMREGRWDKKAFSKARGLYGRTLAVLGCGRIGGEVIRRARGFGMKVRAWSRSLTPEAAEALGASYAATPLEAARGAHALTVHVALGAGTRHLVSAEVLEALAPGAYVVNTARGGVVDEAALLEAIERRGLRAGLDVFEGEPESKQCAFDAPIAVAPGVYGTHHIGASTDQASEAVAAEVVEIVRGYVETGQVRNAVNLARGTDATHTLVVRHLDKVGVLAGVLVSLREAGVNVQEMENIVFAGGDAACARIQVSSWPSEGLLGAIKEVEHVLAASLFEI